MRPAAYYYLAQVWPTQGNRQDQRGTPFRLKSRGRHARAPRRDLSWRELPVAARRVLAALSGTSQAA